MVLESSGGEPSLSSQSEIQRPVNPRRPPSRPQGASERVAQGRGNTRIIWCVDGGDLGAQSQQLSRAPVSGWCVDGGATSLDEVSRFVHSHRDTSSADLPALMFSLSHCGRAHVHSFPRVGSVEESRCGLKLSPGQRLRIMIRPGDDQATSVEVPENLHHGGAEVIYLGWMDQQPWTTRLNPQEVLHWGHGEAKFRFEAQTPDHLDLIADQEAVLGASGSLYVPGGRRGTLEHINSLDLDVMVDEWGVNYLILPGCLELADIQPLRDRFPRDAERSPWLIYRLDSAQALSCYESLLPWVDGLMVSRWELALTTNPDRIPMVTKEVVRRCRQRGKLTIIASHMLGSMLRHATPTRAEVSDIAHAVYDGADAVMLSEDTLKGPYGFLAAVVARKVILDVHQNGPGMLDSSSQLGSMGDGYGSPFGHLGVGVIEPEGGDELEMDVICSAAARTAQRVGARALVCITKTGNTALRLSSLNIHLPVLAITFHGRIARKLKILRGVESLVLKTNPHLDEVLPRVNELLKTTRWLDPGDSYVFVTVTLSSMSREASNLFTIQKIY